MSAPPLTYQIAMAAGRDAGNRSMRKAGRASWNAEDWDAAAEVTNQLLERIDNDCTQERKR